MNKRWLNYCRAHGGTPEEAEKFDADLKAGQLQPFAGRLDA